MKQKTIFICFCALLYSSNINAQKGYTISPSNTLKVHAPANKLSIFDIYQDNISDTTLILKWQKISIDVPAGWDYSLCDLGTCYAIIPDTATMYPVEKGAQGFLGFNVNPKALNGLLTAQFYVYEQGKYSEGDTCTFYITAGTTGIADIGIKNGLIIYPIPAGNDLHITLNVNAISEISIYSSTGVLVKQVVLKGNAGTIDVSDFKLGVYLVRVTQNNQTYTNRFLKF